MARSCCIPPHLGRGDLKVGCVGRQVHGHQCTLLGQVGHAYDSAGRAVGTELFGIRAVHFLEIPNVLQEDVDVHDVVQRGTHLGKHRGKVFYDLLCLAVRVGAGHLGGGRVHAGRSRDADQGANLGEVAVGANGFKHSGGGDGFNVHGLCVRGG
jgi:hypothetical protein